MLYNAAYKCANLSSPDVEKEVRLDKRHCLHQTKTWSDNICLRAHSSEPDSLSFQGNELFPSLFFDHSPSSNAPHLLTLLNASSESLMAKHSASLFQKGYSNWKRWINGLKMTAVVSCCLCTFYTLPHYASSIPLPQEEVMDMVTAHDAIYTDEKHSKTTALKPC